MRGHMGTPEDRFWSAYGALAGAIGSVEGANAVGVRSACDMLVCICACYDVGVLSLCRCYRVGMMAECETYAVAVRRHETCQQGYGMRCTRTTLMQLCTLCRPPPTASTFYSAARGQSESG